MFKRLTLLNYYFFQKKNVICLLPKHWGDFMRGLIRRLLILRVENVRRKRICATFLFQHDACNMLDAIFQSFPDSGGNDLSAVFFL